MRIAHFMQNDILVSWKSWFPLLATMDCRSAYPFISLLYHITSVYLPIFYALYPLHPHIHMIQFNPHKILGFIPNVSTYFNQMSIIHWLVKSSRLVGWMPLFLVTTPTFSDLNPAIPLMFRYKSRFCLFKSIYIYLYILYIYTYIYIYIYISIKTLLKPIKNHHFLVWLGPSPLLPPAAKLEMRCPQLHRGNATAIEVQPQIALQPEASEAIIWVNYNISLTWIVQPLLFHFPGPCPLNSSAIWGWFPLLTMIPSEVAVRSL